MRNCGRTFDEEFFSSDRLLLSQHEYESINNVYTIKRRYGILGFWLDIFASLFSILLVITATGLFLCFVGGGFSPFNNINDAFIGGLAVGGLITGIMRCEMLSAFLGVIGAVVLVYASDGAAKAGFSAGEVEYFRLAELSESSRPILIGILSGISGFFVFFLPVIVQEKIKNKINRDVNSISFVKKVTRWLQNKHLRLHPFSVNIDKETLRPMANIYDEKKAHAKLKMLSESSPEVGSILSSIKEQGRMITNGEAFKVIRKYDPTWPLLETIGPGREVKKREDKCIECSIRSICGIKPGARFAGLYRAKG